MSKVTFTEPQPLLIDGAATLLGYEITCQTPTGDFWVVTVLDVHSAPNQASVVRFFRRKVDAKLGERFSVPEAVFIDTYTRNVTGFTLLKKRG
jgi:hypothetical protein